MPYSWECIHAGACKAFCVALHSVTQVSSTDGGAMRVALMFLHSCYSTAIWSTSSLVFMGMPLCCACPSWHPQTCHCCCIDALEKPCITAAAVHVHKQEGQEVTGRVLHVDPSNKRMSMTLKPALLNSKLPLIASPAAAAPGAKAHGVVTGVKVGDLCVPLAHIVSAPKLLRGQRCLNPTVCLVSLFLPNASLIKLNSSYGSRSAALDGSFHMHARPLLMFVPVCHRRTTECLWSSMVVSRLLRTS
jgi:hypothetical protein